MTVENLIPREDRSSFVARLDFASPEEQDFIMYAYDFAKVSHKGTYRQSGPRYFEHPREVAIILLDECEVKDPNIIAGALLHDVAEDTPSFGSFIGKKYQDWSNRVWDRAAALFNEEVADIQVNISKPPEGLVDIGTEENSLRVYRKNLENASAKTVLIKMADRLHNLRTLADTPRDKQIRKVGETRRHYFPLFEKIEDVYIAEYAYMRSEIDKAIETLQVDE